MITRSLVFSFFLISFQSIAQVLVLQPDRVFDGTDVHIGWVVLVKDENIVAFLMKVLEGK